MLLLSLKQRLLRAAVRVFFWAAVLLLVSWGALTLWVSLPVRPLLMTYPLETAAKSALILLDPDPFLTFDQSLADAAARSLNDLGYAVEVRHSAGVDKEYIAATDLLVVMSNTYNWRPHWRTTQWLKRYQVELHEKPALAVILGAGDTDEAADRLVTQLELIPVTMLGSLELWLLRPNDEDIPDINNKQLAYDRLRLWIKEIR